MSNKQPVDSKLNVLDEPDMTDDIMPAKEQRCFDYRINDP
jgi:hypothetical protein